MARRRRARLEADAARVAAEQAAERMTRLQAVTALLSRALTADEVTQVVLTAGVEALGAAAGSVALVNAADVLELARTVGYPEDLVTDWLRIPLSFLAPLADSVRHGEPVFLASAAWAERYPGAAARRQRRRIARRPISWPR